MYHFFYPNFFLHLNLTFFIFYFYICVFDYFCFLLLFCICKKFKNAIIIHTTKLRSFFFTYLFYFIFLLYFIYYIIFYFIYDISFIIFYFILFYFIVFYFILFILAVLADGGAYPRYHPLLQEQNIKYSGFSDSKSKTLLDSLTFYSTVSSGVSVVRVHLCVCVVWCGVVSCRVVCAVN